MVRTKEIARRSTGGIAPLKKTLASMRARRFGSAFVPRTPLKATPPPIRPITEPSPLRKSVTKAKQPAPAAEVCITCQFCKKRQRLDTEIVEQCRRAEKRKRDAEEYVDLSSEEGSKQASEDDSEDDSEEGSEQASEETSEDDSEEVSKRTSKEASEDDSGVRSGSDDSESDSKEE